jgi:hypothetical protein
MQCVLAVRADLVSDGEGDRIRRGATGALSRCFDLFCGSGRYLSVDLRFCRDLYFVRDDLAFCMMEAPVFALWFTVLLIFFASSLQFSGGICWFCS